MVLLSSSLDNFLQLSGVLLIFLVVLVMVYITTRWIANVQKIQMTGKGLQVVETIRIAGNKYVQVVKAGEVYLVIAVGKDTVTLLAKLTEDEYGGAYEQIQETLSKENGFDMPESFQQALERVKERFSKKQD
ncbi:MAG: flagellar biosynthetic protein FliO [Clostridiales bacterium]|nr:flagellar biosynthetic protein FliO [Clostridiales bacterium]